MEEEKFKEFIRRLKKIIERKFFNAKNSIMGVGWYEASAKDLLFRIDKLAEEFLKTAREN